jgi:FAD/FMN-containing dehydrogenase
LHEVETIVYQPLASLGGSISAEHGIGLLKRDYLGYSRNQEEIKLMRMLKNMLDPKNLLNPGKVIPEKE